MSFDEWRESQRANISGYTERDAYKAGTQSRQAEIDELKKRIDDAVKELECIHFYKTQNSNNAIKILKGNYND